MVYCVSLSGDTSMASMIATWWVLWNNGRCMCGVGSGTVVTIAQWSRCDDDGSTPLYIAYVGGYADIERLLLANEAGVNTPVFVAHFAFADIVRWLIDHEAA